MTASDGYWLTDSGTDRQTGRQAGDDNKTDSEHLEVSQSVGGVTFIIDPEQHSDRSIH